MSNNLNAVQTFIRTFGQEVREVPNIGPGDDKLKALRYELIREELEELREAMENNDIVEVADALTDILYVTYGAGAAFGIDLNATFAEVQRSNMSKLGEDGKPIYREDGKIMKGPAYFKPNLKAVLFPTGE